MMMQIIPVYSANSPIIQVSTNNIYLKAGQENTIKIILQNTGDYNVFDVEAFLSSAVPGITVLSKADQVFTGIDADRSRSYEPILYIDGSVALGAYSLSLTVTYGRTGSTLSQTITVPIGVVVSEAFTPKIVYSSVLEDITVKSGMLNDVEFGFKNTWNEKLDQLEIVLSSSSNSISIQDGVITTVESVGVGESFSINPNIAIIEGTPLGTYTITATISYVDGEGNRYHQSFSLPLNIASAAAARTTIITVEEMKVVENSIQPGDIFNIVLTVKCTGADAYDLLSSLSFAATSPISPLSPSIINLGDLDAGDTTTSTYTLLASGDISAGQYPIAVTISYTNNRGTAKTITETSTILVDGLIDFELLDTPTETAVPGETKELEADLLLIGTESVDFVSIGVVDDDVISRVSGSDEYIGAVDPDSPIPFDVKYRVNEGTQTGDHELTLSVKYRDHLNREHEEQIGLQITVGKATDDNPQPQQTGFWVWIRRLFGLGP
jgi:hypothetical protein